MNKYIFITKEGFTQAPNQNIELDNMQVVGIVDDAENEDDALKQLLIENPWISKSGFDVNELIGYQLKN